MNTAKKLTIFLAVYAIIMKVLWTRLTENTQDKEVALVLFAVSIIIFTITFEMHKIIKSDAEEEAEHPSRRN